MDESAERNGHPCAIALIATDQDANRVEGDEFRLHLGYLGYYNYNYNYLGYT